MKIGLKISVIAVFFIMLAGMLWVSSIQTVDIESTDILSVNNTSTESASESPTRPTEAPTEKVKSVFTKTQLEQTEKIINTELDNMGFNGTFLVSVGNEVIYHKAKGYSDKEKKIKNKIDTKYEIGSCTKQFTATAIARLAEEKRLSLTDKVTNYVKKASIAKDITIEHLINMCSGLPDYLNEYIYAVETGERKKNSTFSKSEFFKWLDKKELIFEPGEYFSYSNTNYYLLGLIIENVTDMKYEEYIYNEILYPLYMDNSSLVMTDTDSHGYLDSDWTEGIKIDSSYFYSAGEMVSTTSDMLRWLNAFDNEKVLSKSMTKKAINIGSEGFNYGFGWFVTDDYYYHTGNTELYYAVDIVTKKNDIKIIGLSNINDTSLQHTALTIMSKVETELFPKENKNEKSTAKN